MIPQEQEIEKMKATIKGEVGSVFKDNMKIFDWDIPENDSTTAAELIIETMQKALDDLKSEVEAEGYDVHEGVVK